MSVRIGNNINSLISYLNFSRVQRKVESSIQKLSTGQKINSSKDDAANLAIAEKLSIQISGIDKARKNSNDGISLIQTSEGTLASIHSLLQRGRNLMVQAANDILSTEDREKIQLEIEEIVEELERYGNDTEFNTTKLLDGKDRVSISSNSDKLGMIKDVSVTGKRVEKGMYRFSIVDSGEKHEVASNSGFVTDDISLQEAYGLTNEQEMFISFGGSKSGNPNETKSIFLKLSPDQTIKDVKTSLREKISQFNMPINIDNSSEGNISIESNMEGTANQISIEPNLLKFDFDNPVKQARDIAYNLEYREKPNADFVNLNEIYNNNLPFQAKSLETKAADGNVDLNINFASFNADSGSGLENGRTIDVNVKSSNFLHIGPNDSQSIDIPIFDATSKKLGIKYASAIKQQEADANITNFDNAINEISEYRALLGGLQNRLEFTASNLDESEINLQSAESRIRDTDVALEMTNFTKMQILSQAGLSMISQSNTIPKSILQLLG